MNEHNPDQIKRFITCLVPVRACNFRCEYCYLTHYKSYNAYNGGIQKFAKSAEYIASYFSPNRLGGKCYFNLCAEGETMMHPEIIELVCSLTQEGHYADIVTNGTLTKKFDELINSSNQDQRSRIFIKFSFHYIELKKHGLLETFVDNVNKVKEAKISYTIEITPYDELIPLIDEIKHFSIERFGALPHITVARDQRVPEIAILTSLDKEGYKKTWGQFNSKLFEFKFELFNRKRCEFCYAGDWSIVVNLESGIYSQCYGGEILGDISDSSKPINFNAIGVCKEPHCFNGHAFLALGDIPELNCPTYADLRNRNQDDGNNWLQPSVNDFFSTKLYDSNELFDNKRKVRTINYNKILHIKNLFFRVKNKAKRIVGIKQQNTGQRI